MAGQVTVPMLSVVDARKKNVSQEIMELYENNGAPVFDVKMEITSLGPALGVESASDAEEDAVSDGILPMKIPMHTR